MKKITFHSIVIAGLLTSAGLHGQEKLPLWNYEELPQHVQPADEDWKDVKGTHVAWGSTDIRYPKTAVPVSATGVRLTGKEGRTLSLKGWKGERVYGQAVVWTATGAEGLNYRFSALKAKNGAAIPADCIEAGFVRYVMTDELNKDGKGGCGHRPDPTLYDSTMVADCIDRHLESMDMSPRQTQAVWMTCWIPQDVPAGTYRGELNVMSGEKRLGKLPLEIEVTGRTLPMPEDWSYRLDLWQNPYAVARYYGVEPWSDAHLEAMRPLMQRLADAGQKTITASITHKPWNGQTEDPFESMVTWMKKVDGSWEYHFDVFDKWVEFMMSCGIDRQINCYSMVPWRLSFQYFDQATNSLKFLETAPGEKEYADFWGGMLKAFSRHLREKGWFDICTIAMDERPMDTMLKTIAVIRQADPEMKISLAGTYHPELENELYDYCITINEDFPEGVVEQRRMEGKISTLYTCCTEAYPNTFTFSPTAEAAWIGYHMAARDVDGYLRWAYNSWTARPLQDSRFRTWAAGDTYIVYPGDRPSVRFERLVEGIQAYEKIKVLREEYRKTGNTEAAAQLEAALAEFSLERLRDTPASDAINKTAPLLNR